MEYKQFGKTEDKLSVLGLGTWQFAGQNDWANFNKEEAIRIVHAAIDSGINFVDTAPVYGLGHSEEVVGQALKGKRDQVFLATKMGLPWDDQKNVVVNLKADSIIKEIDDTLRRLQTDYVDLYQIHWPDPGTDIRETMEALAKVKQSGKARHIGVCNFSLDLLKQAMEVTEVVSHQGLYNVLEPNASVYHSIDLGYRVENTLLPFLEENDQFFLPYSPLLQGLLAGKTSFDKGVVTNNPSLQGDKLAANLKKIEAINSLTGKPIQEVALNWLIAQKAVGPIIAGASKLSQLESNLKALQWTMDSDLKAKIDAIVRG